MNQDAGRGHVIFVTLRLEDGQELPCVLDTGASGSCFDKSLEPKLGKRLGSYPIWHCGVSSESGIYESPKLSLGDCLLQMTGTNVFTHDWKQLSAELGRPVLGVLGIDVLEHYCIQLDFAARKLRFLDSQRANKKDWGKAFFLTNSVSECFCVTQNLVGAGGPGSLIDTGCDGDGWLIPSLYQQWTNQLAPAAGQASSPKALLEGEIYPDVHLHRLEPETVSSGDSHMTVNGIGLQFLSRHLVTFDFPHRTMYLKRTSAGPLQVTPKMIKADGISALEVLQVLQKKGELPGWSKDETRVGKKAGKYFYYSALSGTLEFQKRGDPSVYHFKVSRATENKPWSLQGVWRTDAAGRTMGAYLVQ